MYEDFRNQLLPQQEIFDQLQKISRSTAKYCMYKAEIETALSECLDKISNINNPSLEGSGLLAS